MSRATLLELQYEQSQLSFHQYGHSHASLSQYAQFQSSVQHYNQLHPSMLLPRPHTLFYDG